MSEGEEEVVVARVGEGRGVPGPRPLPKKRALGAVVETVVTNFAEFLEEATSTDVLDEGGGVREEVISGEVRTLPHVPAKTQTTSLDPVVGDTFERGSVFGGHLLARSGWGTRFGRIVLDGGVGGEVGEESGPVLGSLQVLLEERPVIPFQLAILPSTEGHVSHPQNLVPVRGEGHLENSVSEQELTSQLGVEFVRWALRQNLADHAGGKLHAVEGPVVLGVGVAAGHGVEALVRPLGHALDHAGAGAELAGAHVPGELRHVHGLSVALDGPGGLEVEAEPLHHFLIR